MSLSDKQSPRHQATPWALDELEMPEIFAPLGTAPAAPPADEPEMNAGKEVASPQELARIEAAAYARGRADGEKIACNDVLPRLEHAIAALTDAMDCVHRHRARWMANIEENIAVIAVVAARHLIAREVVADATVVSNLVQRALAQFPLDHAVNVRLHPDDVDTCEEHVKAVIANRGNEIRWTSDPLIQRGGALVEGRERIIDGRVDTALERVYHKLGNLQA